LSQPADPAFVPGLFTADFARDPYPAYAALRESAPVHRVRLPSGVHAWLVTRYADARVTLADPRLSKNPRRAAPEHWRDGRVGLPGEQRSELGGHLLNIDPPDHTRLRRLVSKAFTPRRMEQFRPRVQQLTDDLLDAVEPAGHADLIGSFAFPLPIVVICEMLGVPAEDQQDFRDWASGMLGHRGPASAGPGGAGGTGRAAPRGGVGRSVRRIRAYLAEPIERKRADLGDDLLSGLITASDHDQHLTGAEVASMAFILLFAGFETTVNLIGNGTLALLRNPEQLAAVRADPALLPGAVEEFLRFDGPVEMATWRFTTEPVRIGGVDVPAGEPVLVVLAAADRDPAVFPAPDQLDVRRADNPHLAFGLGIHYCIGAPLARIEGQVAIGTLLRRFPRLELAVPPEELRWRGGLIMRGLQSLPVTLS
jgi:cytochrome P450